MDTTRMTELACAIRMTATRLRREEQNKPPVVVRFDAPAADHRPAESSIPVPGEASGADTAQVLEKHFAARGELPDAVTVGEQGCFSILDPVADSHNAPGRLCGCIAVVTGSAQGFGRGIAEQLAGEGAAIVVADLNEELGQRCAEELNRDYGDGTALFSHADVTDADSLKRMTTTAVGAFGGLDMFIANAGVLIAGPVEEMEERAFDLVTNVNYKAFFLCTRAAAGIMRRQHTFDNGHFMDIIQINSKSGLQGSNRNFAYAGSKFGGIGLVQSFAMELIQDNIKVNAICPGNFFEGPLWSDPDKGLFVQYLKAGKVPGATTIDDVKDFYVSKVPMKRGCVPADVARAIYYAHEQQYETGQAIPVTGGQVMLR
jgi:NAD(P)-dependent dehydrogenase (short-subunit alcohol dehydrogenase family)